MKTVYLHVGNFKTGTSAIQQFCSSHSDQLLEQGLLYPQSGRAAADMTNHSDLSLTLLRENGLQVPPWYKREASFDQLLSELGPELADSPAQNILISSEEFTRFAAVPEASGVILQDTLRKAFEPYRVKVIMCVREPLAFSKSWYNQVNKGFRPVARFCDFFNHLNEAYIAPGVGAKFWRATFGDSCLVPLLYEENSQNHIASFLAATGIVSLPGVSFETAARINPKRDESTLERDRLAKIHTLKAIGRRKFFLNSAVLSSSEKFQEFEDKVHSVSENFDRFCRIEGLDGGHSRLSTISLLQHELKINTAPMPATTRFRSWYFALMDNDLFIRTKRYIKRNLARYSRRPSH